VFLGNAGDVSACADSWACAVLASHSEHMLALQKSSLHVCHNAAGHAASTTAATWSSYPYPWLPRKLLTRSLLMCMQAHIYLCDDAPKGVSMNKDGPSFRDERSAMMGLGTDFAPQSVRDLARGDPTSPLHHKVCITQCGEIF
jgi:hypothetical protein